jgi:Protein of unknown function (DUF2585)
MKADGNCWTHFCSFRDFKPWLAMACATVLTAIQLRCQGRVWWCQAGDWSPWSGDIKSRHNSQHLFDPYTFTHILHGVFYFWLLSLIFRKMPLVWRLFMAVCFGCAWEILENSAYIIERYRTATISLQYFGDSVANSITDIASCGVGFWIAWKLGFWRSLLFFAFTEVVLLLWIHDSLLLNIIMLVYPIEGIKQWQIG